MELRPYQREDVERAKKFNSFGIFNEQRTGKTPTAITIVTEQGFNKVLVLCPKSAIYQWAEEYKKWSGGADVIVVSGTAQTRLKQISQWTKGAVVMSYDTLKTTASSQGLIDLVLKHNPDAVIADEAHRFKNTKSAVFQAVNKLIKIPKRISLTGTPAHGKPEEIYAIIHWLYPEVYNSYWKFIEKYFIKVRRTARDGRSFIEIAGFQTGMEMRLQSELASISSQRKRKEVMPWLPAKDYEDVKLPLTPQQTRHLKELAKFYETDDIVVQGTLDRLIRYRQICLAPQLLGLKGGSPKLEWILDYLSDYPDTPTIIFSKFTSFLHLLEEELGAKGNTTFGKITGEVSAIERQQYVTAFQQGSCKLLLINIDAGKEALTLDTGECIIFTDQYPPASDIQQAEDRFVATTQSKADKPHKIVRLMMKDSYDEDVYKLVAQRATATDLLNDYKKYLAKI